MTSNYGLIDAADYYGCCQCQTQHFEDEPIYKQHIGFQSKQGIQQISRSFLIDKRLKELEAVAPAADPSPAKEG